MKTHATKTFTLVELMVVAIIVAILAAVAIPLMQGNVDRAIVTEAESACSTINSLLRTNYAETGDYSQRPDGTNIATDFGELNDAGDTTDNLPALGDGDLNGTYFDDECYAVEFYPAGVVGPNPGDPEFYYIIFADGTNTDNDAAKGETVQDKAIGVMMFSNGIIKRFRNYDGGKAGTGDEF